MQYDILSFCSNIRVAQQGGLSNVFYCLVSCSQVDIVELVAQCFMYSVCTMYNVNIHFTLNIILYLPKESILRWLHWR